MKKPSILLAAESLAPGKGGICRVARLMARVLAAESAAGRLTAEAIALNDTTVDPTLGLPVQTCGGSRLRFVLRVQRAQRRHTHAIYDFAGIGRAHRLWPLPVRPFATWIHGIEVWENARADYLNVLHRAGQVWCNSQYTLRRASALHRGCERAQLCWLATETDDAAPERVPAIGRQVLIVGRIDAGDRPEWPRYKGHDALIACWPEVVRHVSDARLVIIGDGPGRPQVEALARASSACAAIELRGFVEEEALARAFAQAHVFAMPSRGEGFGLVYIEAMRHGLPVIASRHDAAPEINVDGETGYNVDLDCPSELADRIVELLSDDALARKYGESGRKRWREHFRFSAFHRRFVERLEDWTN